MLEVLVVSADPDLRVEMCRPLAALGHQVQAFPDWQVATDGGQPALLDLAVFDARQAVGFADFRRYRPALPGVVITFQPEPNPTPPDPTETPRPDGVIGSTGLPHLVGFVARIERPLLLRRTLRAAATVHAELDALHERILAGDAAAREEIARRLLPELRRRCRHALPEEDPHDLDHVVDETIVDDLAEPERFHPSRGRLLPWLTRIAVTSSRTSTADEGGGRRTSGRWASSWTRSQLSSAGRMTVPRCTP